MHIRTKILITGAVFAAFVLAIPLLGTLHPKEIQTSDGTELFAQADAIDAYFKRRHMPLAGYGLEMAVAARANNIDWRLLPAIAVRESSGGLEACWANVFGWASCRLTFSSVSEGIQTVAWHLGGNATSTAAYYKGKTTHEILHAYNPPTIVPLYAEQVEGIMAAIGGATTRL